MVVETAVGADVVVEVDLAVEVGVAVVGVFDEQCGRVERFAVERRGRAIDGLELGRLEEAECRVVGDAVAGGGGREAVSGPGAASAGGADEVADGREGADAAVIEDQVVVVEVERRPASNPYLISARRARYLRLGGRSQRCVPTTRPVELPSLVLRACSRH